MEAIMQDEQAPLCESLLEHIKELQEELSDIASHPTGWPPPEEENMSMRRMAAWALQRSVEFTDEYLKESREGSHERP
jgi:hypothetical protein